MAYADDLVLLAPTAMAMRLIIIIIIINNLKNLQFTLNVRTMITLRKQQKLFLHDFVAISAR